MSYGLLNETIMVSQTRLFKICKLKLSEKNVLQGQNFQNRIELLVQNFLYVSVNYLNSFGNVKIFWDCKNIGDMYICCWKIHFEKNQKNSLCIEI